MMCSVLALNTASYGASVGHRAWLTSSRSGGGVLGSGMVLDHVRALPDQVRQVRGEVHRVLAGAAADLEDAAAVREHGAQHRQDRVAVALRTGREGLVHRWE
jgi:hypothetical protein